MKLSAIVPVKSFSKAKSRLQIGRAQREDLCKIMLEEILRTLNESRAVSETIVVSRDEQALRMADEFGAVRIVDDEESGVNHAVSLADRYLVETGKEASVVLPQDIPLIKNQDVDFLLSFSSPPRFSLVVPSRTFDGTNALVRMPVDLMETHYDEGSYRVHLSAGRTKTPNTSLIFIRRVMLDIDSREDLEIVVSVGEKPELCERMLNTLE